MIRGKGRAKYKDEYAEQVYGLRALKLSNKDIAKYFNTNESTLRTWIQRYPEFREWYIKGNPDNIKANHFNIAEKLVNEINKALNNNDLYRYVEKVKVDKDYEELKEFTFDSINNKKLSDIVTAFEKLQKAQRQTLNIVDADKLTRQDKLKETKHKQSMDNKKFEQDKQQHADKMAMEEKKIKKDDIDISEDDGFIEAMQSEVKNIWADEVIEDETNKTE